MIYLTHYRTAYSTTIEMMEDAVFPQKVHWFPETYDRVKTGMFYAPHRLAEKVLDPELMNYLKNNPVGKTAFILAGGNMHFAGINQRNYPDNGLNYQYRFLPFTLTQVYAGRTAQLFGNMDLITTDASACASSLKVLMDVQNLMWLYGYDRVIVLSVEDGVSNAVLEFFGESKAVLTAKDEAAGAKPSAFDFTHGGFRVGQGACLAVFESGAAVYKLGVNPHAEFLGSYSASEASTNAIGQLESGEGYMKAIEGCLYVSKKTADKVAIVKTHGTGTKSNDLAEGQALRRMLPDFVATSYKQKIGHTMGTSGLLETLLLLNHIKSGIIPKIENRSERDTVFLSDSITPPDGLSLSLAARMGNM